MVQLSIYLVCVVLVVVGFIGLVSAMSIDKKFSMMLACLFSCVPIGVAVWLFWSAGLKIGDFPRLFQEASHQIEKILQGVKDGVAARTDFDKLTKGL